MRITYAHMVTARARKTATNLSLRADLVRRAKELSINLSEVVEPALEHAIRVAERETWLSANEQAIREYNAELEKRGTFGDDWRRF